MTHENALLTSKTRSRRYITSFHTPLAITCKRANTTFRNDSCGGGGLHKWVDSDSAKQLAVRLFLIPTLNPMQQ
jgi:hypothetical protein